MKRTRSGRAEGVAETCELFRSICASLNQQVTKEDAYTLLGRLSGGDVDDDDAASSSGAYEAVDAARESSEEAAPLLPPLSHEDPGCVIYILQLEGDHWYVGRSDTEEGADLRIAQHAEGTASRWTSKHPFVKVHSRRSGCSVWAEDADTLRLMAEKGIDNVRGGTFCNIALVDYQVRAVREMICGATGCCFRCLKVGHCRRQCTEHLDG